MVVELVRRSSSNHAARPKFLASTSVAQKQTQASKSSSPHHSLRELSRRHLHPSRVRVDPSLRISVESRPRRLPPPAPQDSSTRPHCKSLHHDVASHHHHPLPSCGACRSCRREEVWRSVCRLQQCSGFGAEGHILGFPGTKRGSGPDQPRHRRERCKGGPARCLPQQPVLLRSARRPHKGFQCLAAVPGLARLLPGLSANTSLRFPCPLRHQQGIHSFCSFLGYLNVNTHRSSAKVTLTATFPSLPASTTDGLLAGSQRPPLRSRPPPCLVPEVPSSPSRTTTLATTSLLRSRP